MAQVLEVLHTGCWCKYVLPVAIGYVVERMLVKPGTLRHPADADISAPVTLALGCKCWALNVAPIFETFAARRRILGVFQRVIRETQ